MIRLITIALVFASLVMQAQSLNGQTIGSTVDVKHIALDLRFDWSKKQAYGTSTITCSVPSAATSIKLHAAQLSINRVFTKNNKQLIFELKEKDELVITLDRAYKAHERITVIIDYRTNWINASDPNALGGSFGKGLRFFEPTSLTPTRRRQIWSQGEAECNRYWFPGNDKPDDLRTSEFKATVDKGLTAISNGNLVSVKDNSDGTRTFHYKSDVPYPNYLTSFVVGEYVEIVKYSSGTPLHTYCYPDEKEAAEATIERLPDMVLFFAEKTGVKYPYTHYSQVMVQDYPFPSLIGQHQVSTISDNMIDDYSTHADFLYLWDGVESNALASQWYGNLIAAKDWSHVWLVKSLAHYLEALYTDHKNGHEEYLMWYHTFVMGATLGDWSAGYHHPIVTQQFDDLENFVGDNYAKMRGMLVLRMLQKELGDAQWWPAIQSFTKTYAGKLVSTVDFQKSLEKSTGKDLTWFFDQWLYKMGQPEFAVTKQYDPEKKQFHLVLKQVQTLDDSTTYAQVKYFQGSMEIELDNRIERIWLKPQEENVFVFPLTKAPNVVTVDFENTWIANINFDRTPEELLQQLQYSRDILSRNAALVALANLIKSGQATTELKQKTITAMYHVLHSNAYWRLRVAAISQLNGIMANSPDNATQELLQRIIMKEPSWLRASAIGALGNTRQERYADLYIHHLSDSSERVVSAAALALGKSKSPKAFDALMKLKDAPAWKKQRLMSALGGLAALGDARGVPVAVEALKDIHSPRWFLGNFWDYPFIAAQTLATLGAGQEGYPIVLARIEKAITSNNQQDIFQHLLLITTLADPRGSEVFEKLKIKFKDNPSAMTAITQFEAQFNEAIGKK